MGFCKTYDSQLRAICFYCLVNTKIIGIIYDLLAIFINIISYK